MLSSFEIKILEFLNTQKLFEPDTNILLAVSGGADSVALLAVLHQLQQKKAIDIQLTIGHVNHSLRGKR
jgi:tRNA(Ile)-lysidine synthase TilS/MesJ